MKIVNFQSLEVEKAERHKEYKIVLDLGSKLDLNYSVFLDYLSENLKKSLKPEEIKKIEVPINFQIYTGLSRADLKIWRDLILSQFIRAMVEKREIKREEKRLGIPKKLEKKLEGMHIHLMDMINFPLLTEKFNVEFYDERKYSYKPLVKKG